MKIKLLLSLQDWIVLINVALKIAAIFIVASLFIWQMKVNHVYLENVKTLDSQTSLPRKDTINPIIAICPRNEYLGQLVRIFPFF